VSAPHEILERLGSLGIAPTGVADDSRQVRPGDLFLAYPGDLADGRRYIPDAIARGAIAVVWQPGGDFAWNPAWTAANLQADGLRALAGPLAHAVYGEPSAALSLIAITGTNGKTTVSQFIAHALAGRCAVIGTLGAGFPGALEETGFTTPEATTLMRSLAEFRRLGAASCALEASSIGIEEGRMNGALVDVAVFTNFTRDHLDYHGSMEAYAAAKRKLFVWPGLRTAIVNLDDAFGRQLQAATTASSVLGYSIGELGDVRAESLRETPVGQCFTLVLPDARLEVETGLLGRYNVSNLLAVAAVLYDAGFAAAEIGARLSALQAPAGRMERLGGIGEPLLVVDYAHTPDALEQALTTLRAHTRGRLFCVFGCGGERDTGKRPEMGAIAEKLADVAIVTDDNPRGEDGDAIVAAIVGGFEHRDAARVMRDRGAAIREAIATASDDDVVLIAGKGHEPYQEIAGVKHPFDDTAVARAALGVCA
jgi:UDP-N-acetylmuramoyl-L-alanyl-D-glutamate--2,6-diaminopimelate ligase